MESARPNRLFETLKPKIGIAASLVTLVSGGWVLAERWQAHTTPDLSGSWEVSNSIASTSYSPYTGLVLGYRVFLRQSGNQLEGQGEKTAEGSHALQGPARSPVTVEGTVYDNRVRLVFVERGAKRQTTGAWTLVVSKGGASMVGTFEHTAANASGTARFTRGTK